MISVTSDFERIYNIANKVSAKVLVQVEGATCSGKSSLVSQVYGMLKRKGIAVTVIQEAATRIFRENENLLKQLFAHSTKSNQWRKTKAKLQQRVLSEQIDGLEQFAEDDNCRIALMDRGGASTAYHTIPLFSEKEKDFAEEICKEIAKMSSQILLLSPLGFLQRNPYRYQKTFEEIENEAKGIKYYLTKWKLDYLEIPPFCSSIRAEIGVRHILNFLNDTKLQF